jgi:hypothetical protein
MLPNCTFFEKWTFFPFFAIKPDSFIVLGFSNVTAKTGKKFGRIDY